MKIVLPLVTRRLAIRDFRRSDLSAVEKYASDPETVRYMTWGPNTREDSLKNLEKKLAEQVEVPRNSFDLAVVLKAKRQVVGSASLWISELKHRGGHFGYVYNRKFWGRGIATEALAALLEFGFGQLNLHRIHGWCDVRNRASARVMTKCGMRKEGVRRKDEWVKGKWRSSAYYAILEEEWKSRSRRRIS